MKMSNPQMTSLQEAADAAGRRVQRALNRIDKALPKDEPPVAERDECAVPVVLPPVIVKINGGHD